MPIKVACKCGQRFAAPDKLAGKAVKCPKCGQPLRIPAAGTQQPGAQKPVAQQPRPQQPTPQQGAGLGGLLDEIGLAPAPTTGPKCPSCGAAITQGAVICVECGFNSMTGQRMQSLAEGQAAAGAPMTEGEKLLAKAEKEIRESPALKQGRHDFGDEGFKAYMVTCGMITAIVAGLIFGAGFLWFVNTQIFNEDTNVLTMVSFFVMIVGLLLILFSWVQVVGVSFTEHPTHGMLTLLTGIYFVIYMLMRSWKLQAAIIVYLVGCNMLLLALGFLIESVADRPVYLRTAWLLMVGVVWDLWILGLAQITGNAFHAKKVMPGVFLLVSTMLAITFGPISILFIAGLLQYVIVAYLITILLAIFLSAYPCVYGFMDHERCLKSTILSIVGAVLFIILFCTFFAMHAIPEFS